VGEEDTTFISNVTSSLKHLYPGMRIGSWGQLQGNAPSFGYHSIPLTFHSEFKIDMDNQTDQHRHLSHLLGVYPGWEISGYYGQSLGNQSILDAAAISLNARGNGTVDSNAGQLRKSAS
jgi:alpha-L-fucosidase 2